LAYVASGRLDGFWEFGLKPWDIAAGALLIREAGGLLDFFRGGLKLDKVTSGLELPSPSGLECAGRQSARPPPASIGPQ
ncbi:MAG: hypothetical protein OSB75_12670, partial [Dehalococcoidia bacterium]|nr:hypothetical protein [Dehalococcoidia bacterium]